MKKWLVCLALGAIAVPTGARAAPAVLDVPLDTGSSSSCVQAVDATTGAEACGTNALGIAGVNAGGSDGWSSVGFRVFRAYAEAHGGTPLQAERRTEAGSLSSDIAIPDGTATAEFTVAGHEEAEQPNGTPLLASDGATVGAGIDLISGSCSVGTLHVIDYSAGGFGVEFADAHGTLGDIDGFRATPNFELDLYAYCADGPDTGVMNGVTLQPHVDFSVQATAKGGAYAEYIGYDIRWAHLELN